MSKLNEEPREDRSCDYCGADGPGKACGACRKARYCDQTCQRAGWKEHKLVCNGGRRHSSSHDSEDDHDSTDYRRSHRSSGRVSIDSGTSLHHSASGSSFVWWEGLSVRRQRERLMMSFQLRNHDADHAGAQRVANQHRGRVEDDLHRAFLDYARKAKRKGLLPDACDDTFLYSSTTKENARYILTKNDVIEKFGRSSGEHRTLRLMADSITGKTLSS